MNEIQLLTAWTQAAVTRVRANRKNDRGDITQTVIIVALFAAAAIAIATLIIVKFTNKAKNIPTD